MGAPEKIRVLRIINRFNLGGPTYNAAYLTKYLDDRFETLLVGGSKDESEASSTYILDSLGLKPTIIQDMKRSISVKDISAYNQLDKLIKEYRPHVVHTHASKAGTLGRLAAHRNNVPVIIHTFHGHVFHSYFGALKTNFYKSIERWLAKRSDSIVAISKEQKRELSQDHKICKESLISVIPLGFDLSRFSENLDEKRSDFRAKYGLGNDDVAIVIVGRLVPIKNHKMFVDIAAALAPRHKNARFFIVGDGESKDEIQTYCDSKSLAFTEQEPPSEEKPLCFTSWIKNVDWVYAGTDIVCLTSLNEGTPVSLIEAQSAGQPIVSTKVGGIHDVVLDGTSALLTDRFDTDLFVHHVEQLIENPDLRDKMGAAGMVRVNEMYSYKRLVKDIEDLYSTILKKKNINQ